jgi:hypothetical protein
MRSCDWITPIDGPDQVSYGNFAKDPSNLTEIPTAGLLGACRCFRPATY